MHICMCVELLPGAIDEHKMQQLPALQWSLAAWTRRTSVSGDARAGHHQLPGTPDYEEGSVQLSWEVEKRDSAALMWKKNGGKMIHSIALNLQLIGKDEIESV